MAKKSKDNPMFGKPWSVRSVCPTYAEALALKEKLLSNPALQVKSGRTPDDTFRVRVRSMEQKSKKKKKSGKGKKKS